MRRLSLFLACCLFALPASAQPPQPPQPPIVKPVATITVPDKVPAGGRLVLTAEKSTSKTPLSWAVVFPKDATFEVGSLAAPNTLLMIRQPVPGLTYRFALVATGDVPPFAFDFADVTVDLDAPPADDPTTALSAKIDSLSAAVSAGFASVMAKLNSMPTPTPVPPPPGPPVPPPVNLARPFIVTLVSDSNAMTPGLADVRDSLTLSASPLQSAIATMGGRGTSVDVNSAEYVRRNLSPFLGISDVNGPAVSPPAIVVQDSRGHVINKVPAPADSAKLIDYLKGLTGSN